MARAGVRNIEFNYRWTLGDADRVRRCARELVQLAPDVILSAATLAIRAHDCRLEARLA
jgi:ABC-type uncharacterized transport system substrate-binding protein